MIHLCYIPVSKLNVHIGMQLSHISLCLCQVKDEISGGSKKSGMAAVMAKILSKPLSTDQAAIMSKAISERQLAQRKRRHLDNGQVCLSGSLSILGIVIVR